MCTYFVIVCLSMLLLSCMVLCSVFITGCWNLATVAPQVVHACYSLFIGVSRLICLLNDMVVYVAICGLDAHLCLL